jgi:hypothetical protein
MRTTHIVPTAALTASLLAMAAVAATSAQSAPLEREHYEGTDSDTFDCGGVITLHRETSFNGVFMLKQGRKGDPTPYFFDNYQYSEVVTAVPDTGRWFTRQGNGLYKDLQITNVSGTIYQFDVIETGQPFIIKDMNGQTVVKDYGLLHTRFQVDTKGDTNLDNDEFVDGSWELVADRGSHPGFYIDYCQTAKDLLTG